MSMCASLELSRVLCGGLLPVESNVGVLVKRWRMFVGVAEVIFHYSARLVSAANIQVTLDLSFA